MPNFPAPDSPTVGSDLDLECVRSRFPALATGWAFFDNAGGSQVLATVGDRMRDYLLHSNVQLGASNEISRLASERVKAGQAAAARLVGAADPDEMVLGPSTTQLLHNLARAMVGHLLGPRDEVIVTNVDHEANIGPWRRLAGYGVEIKTWNLDPSTLRLRLEDLETLLSPRTKLVVVTHASNVLGTISPVAGAIERAHAAGALALVDGVAWAPHRRVDVAALGADFYVTSHYKIFGPHLAGLWGKAEHLARLANLSHFFTAEHEHRERLQPGKASAEAVASLPAIVDYLEELGRQAGARAEEDPLDRAFAAIAEHEERLATRFLEFLRDRPGVQVLGEATADRVTRVAIVSFFAAGRTSGEIVKAAESARVILRAGHFSAKRLVDALVPGQSGGAVRFSPVHYNTLAEVDRLGVALAEVLPG
jgi:cysteine desulfurase family protein (TIGR01976 family)